MIKMDEATAKKYYGMYEDTDYVPDEGFKPDIQATPQIEVDKRQYTRHTAKKIVPNNSSSTANVPSNFPNNPAYTPNNYNPTKIPGRKFSINGKSIGDFIKDVVYYNPNNPLDPGNYADAVAIGALASEKYARGPFEKVMVTGGIIIGGLKTKKYLYDKFVK